MSSDDAARYAATERLYARDQRMRGLDQSLLCGGPSAGTRWDLDIDRRGLGSLFALFHDNCLRTPDKLCLSFVDEHGLCEESLTYRQVLDRVLRLAVALREKWNVNPGDRLVLSFPPSNDFYIAFWSCVGIGAIPVPVCPPDVFNPNADATCKLRLIIADCKPAWLLTNRVLYDLIRIGGFSAAGMTTTKDSILNKKLWLAVDDVFRGKKAARFSKYYPFKRPATRPFDAISWRVGIVSKLPSSSESAESPEQSVSDSWTADSASPEQKLSGSSRSNSSHFSSLEMDCAEMSDGSGCSLDVSDTSCTSPTLQCPCPRMVCSYALKLTTASGNALVKDANEVLSRLVSSHVFLPQHVNSVTHSQSTLCGHAAAAAQCYTRVFQWPYWSLLSGWGQCVFLQYTSGSTGNPKGVEVCNGQILSNCQSIVQMMLNLGDRSRRHQLHEEVITLSWIPHYHDMGLVGAALASMTAGVEMISLSPLTFIANPLIWVYHLSMASRHCRRIMSALPTFGLDLVCKRLSSHLKAGKVCAQTRSLRYLEEADWDKKKLAWVDKGPTESGSDVCTSWRYYRYRSNGSASPGLHDIAPLTDKSQLAVDLRSMQSLILGAEPIRSRAMRNFANIFEPYGFDRCCFVPAYGLAENVLHVMAKRDTQCRVEVIEVCADALERDGRVRLLRPVGITPRNYRPLSTKSKKRRKRVLVACGSASELTYGSATTLVIIVDPDTGHEVADGCVGEVWVWGASKTRGYYRNKKATNESFRAVLRRCHPHGQLVRWLSFWKQQGFPRTVCCEPVLDSEWGGLCAAVTPNNGRQARSQPQCPLEPHKSSGTKSSVSESKGRGDPTCMVGERRLRLLFGPVGDTTANDSVTSPRGPTASGPVQHDQKGCDSDAIHQTVSISDATMRITHESIGGFDPFPTEFAHHMSRTGFLKTGDQGFFHNDHLYICGRLKEMICINGHNVYLSDLECSVRNHLASNPFVRPGGIALYQSHNEDGSEQLHLAIEVKPTIASTGNARHLTKVIGRSKQLPIGRVADVFEYMTDTVAYRIGGRRGRIVARNAVISLGRAGYVAARGCIAGARRLQSMSSTLWQRMKACSSRVHAWWSPPVNKWKLKPLQEGLRHPELKALAVRNSNGVLCLPVPATRTLRDLHPAEFGRQPEYGIVVDSRPPAFLHVETPPVPPLAVKPRGEHHPTCESAELRDGVDISFIECGQHETDSTGDSDKHAAPSDGAASISTLMDRITESACVGILRDFQIPIAEVVFLRPGSVKKTSSGKIQHHGTRDFITSGEAEREGLIIGRRVHDPQSSLEAT